jgi:hypothetical protein
LRFIFIVIVVLLIVGARSGWGRGRILRNRPGSEVGIVVVVLLVWLLLNYVPRGFSR